MSRALPVRGDFSRVRVHADGESAGLANAFGADAPAREFTDPNPAYSAQHCGLPGPIHDHAKHESRPLAPEVRARMERELGADLGDVRVHTGTDAQAAARDLEASAFATGNDVVVGATAPPLNSTSGNALLAHELTHVVQQRRAAQVIAGISAPTDAAEHAAAAHDPDGGGTVHAVQRQQEPDRLTATATRDEVEHVLAEYLAELLQKQGGPNLKFEPEMIDALTTLLNGNRLLVTSIAESMKLRPPAEVARYVAGKLPLTVPETRIAKIRIAPKVVAPVQTPKTFTDATLGRFIDLVVKPIIKGLSRETQDKVLRAIKDGAAAGSVAALKAGLDKAGLSGSTLDGVVSAFENALTKEPGTTTDRQQEGAGHPRSHKEMSPSIGPEAPKAPGENVTKPPAVPYQEPGVHSAPEREAPAIRIDLAAERAAAGVDPNALVPPGTPEQRINAFPRAQVWALDVARRLEQAQRDKEQTVRLELIGPYVGDAAERAYDRAQKIVFALRDLLPHHAVTVRSVILVVDGRPARGFPLH